VLEAIHVPEEAGTWRLAAELFGAASGRALLVAISRSGAGTSAFTPAQALHQALSSDEAGAPRTILQIRGLGARPGAPADMLAIGRPRAGVGDLPAVLSDMLRAPGPLSFVPRWRLLEDAPELAALVGVRDALVAFSAAFTGDDAAILWFPPALRRVYAVGDPCLDLRRLSALDLVPAGRACATWVRDEAAMVLGGAAPGVVDARTAMSHETLAGAPASRRGARGAADAREPGHGERKPASAAGPGTDFLTALAQVEAYAESGNLHWLRLVLAEPGLRLQAGLGRATGRGFLALCETGADRRCALVWLGPALPGRTVVPSKIRAVGPALWRRTRTLVVDGEER
jgi:hypothetical protein